jgi:hypothetical protein
MEPRRHSSAGWTRLAARALVEHDATVVDLDSARRGRGDVPVVGDHEDRGSLGVQFLQELDELRTRG